MVPVLQSLKALKASFSDGSYDKNSLSARRRWSLPEDHTESRGDDRNYTDGFPSKEGSEIDISDAKISELLKSNSLRVKFSNIILVNCVQPFSYCLCF